MEYLKEFFISRFHIFSESNIIKGQIHIQLEPSLFTLTHIFDLTSQHVPLSLNGPRKINKKFLYRWPVKSSLKCIYFFILSVIFQLHFQPAR